MLERVLGRDPDLLVTSGGGLIAPEDVVRRAVASAPEAVVDLEIAQREDLSLDVRVVLGNDTQTSEADSPDQPIPSTSSLVFVE